MNNLRTCTLTQDDQLNFDPVAFTERLRAGESTKWN